MKHWEAIKEIMVEILYTIIYLLALAIAILGARIFLLNLLFGNNHPMP